MTKSDLINRLALEPHIEGGYFARTYTSPYLADKQAFVSSIYYLLTDDRPIGHFHRNKSDIIHYFHGGSAIRYYLIDPQGHLTVKVLGLDVTKEQSPQLLVSGGTWKASELITGEFGLISEAVCPEFDYNDMELATLASFASACPTLQAKVRHLIKQP